MDTTGNPIDSRTAATVAPDTNGVVAFHPADYIEEELVARHWSRDRLASAMTPYGDTEQWAENRLAIDLCLEVGRSYRNLRLGAMADRLATAFGTSAELWLNLEAEWLRQSPSAREATSSGSVSTNHEGENKIDA